MRQRMTLRFISFGKRSIPQLKLARKALEQLNASAECARKASGNLPAVVVGHTEATPAQAQGTVHFTGDRGSHLRKASGPRFLCPWDKQGQSLAEKPGLPTVTPVTKIGSSFEELRYYKIPKIKRQAPPTKEHGSGISRPYPVSPLSKKQREEQDKHCEEYSSFQSSSPAVSASSSNVLLDKIIEDMNKAYPKVPRCYVSCGDSCPLRNQVDEFPKSPAKCPLDDSQRLSKSAIVDCAPVSSEIRQNKQMKICTVCKRKNVSEGVGQDTCVRCSLYERFNKEQAAMKELCSKERLAVHEPDAPAKVQARRGSSDVENKELVVSIPTRSRSRSKSRTGNSDKMKTALLQANEHENVVRKRKRKTCLTLQIISSSDDSCHSEDDICAVAASAVCAPRDGASLSQSRQARPQRKCRALSESPQNVAEEPPQKDSSQNSEKPLTTGYKNRRANSTFRRMQSIKDKSKSQRMQGKGCELEKLRRKAMRKAWKEAKDTEDYLRTLGEMEKSTKTRKTLSKLAKKREEPKKLRSRNSGRTDANPALKEHEQLKSFNGDHIDAKPALEEHEQLESVKDDHIDVKPASEEHGPLESVKGDHTDANLVLEEHEQLESVKGDHTDTEPAFEEHEQLESVKCDHTDAKPASEEQSGKDAIDVGRFALESLVSASRPALVVASCCSLSLTDWEGMENESVDSFNSEVVRGEADKVVSTCTLPSDWAQSDSHASTNPKKRAEKGVLPSAVVPDLSDDIFNGKHVDPVMECFMGLPYLLSFEDDGAMSVTIRDGASGGGGGGGGDEGKGFPAKKLGGLVPQPQEVGPPSSSDADNVATFTASLQEGGSTLNPADAVGKSHLDREGAPTVTHMRKEGMKIPAGKPGFI
ncbi:hypothetical protein MTO96_019169 [Rhipicephalus appendiculatus]